MKYKVLKPFVDETGKLWTLDEILKTGQVSVKMPKALEAFGFIEEIKPEYKRWRAEYKGWRAEDGQLYYAVTSDGVVQSDAECHAMIDNYRYATGNYFKTKEEAESYYYDQEYLYLQIINGLFGIEAEE